MPRQPEITTNSLKIHCHIKIGQVPLYQVLHCHKITVVHCKKWSLTTRAVLMVALLVSVVSTKLKVGMRQSHLQCRHL